MAESDGASGWDKLKKTPATIVVDGLSINDYLSLIRDQVNSLHTSQKQQQNLIQNLTKELENERLKNIEMNQKFQELNNRIQTLEKTDSNEILKTLSQHENEIKELVSRPIVDLSEAIRLSIVEKKLASFYGDDINILGRVRTLLPPLSSLLLLTSLLLFSSRSFPIFSLYMLGCSSGESS
jgi:septal ring factor EnvC (AmiA/AmiB activator)